MLQSSLAYIATDWTPLCNATIPANTDVGGYGIIISFELAAWTSNFVGLIPAWAVLRPNIIWLDERAKNLRFFPPDPSRYTIKATRQALRGLCDLQLLTGLSIVIAGFATMHSSTYYHQQLIVNYWWLTLNSFWVARVGLNPTNESDGTTDGGPTRSTTTSVMNLHDEELQNADENSETTRREPDQSNLTNRISLNDEEAQIGEGDNEHTIEEQVYDEDSLRSIIRVVAVLISVTLGLVYQSIIYREQVNGWDSEDGHRCYLYNDNSIPDSIWLWVAGLGFYVIMLFSTIPPFIERFLPWLTRKANEINKSLREEGQALWRPIPTQMRPSSHALCYRSIFVLRGIARRVLSAFIFVFLVLCWLVQQFLAIWSFGNGWYPILLAAFWAFAGWTTWDIADQKHSNINLVEDTENEWGFGQVLPMMLLSAICLQFLDAFYKKTPTVSHRGST